MRTVLPFLCITLHLAVPGCATLPSENRLVGTWVARAVSTSDQLGTPPKSTDAVAKMVFKADHTYATYLTNESAEMRGMWRVEENELVLRHGKIEERVPIAKLTREKLVLLVGHEFSENTWWRSGAF